MKKTIILFTAVLLGVVSGCKKDTEVEITKLSISSPVTNVEYTSAVITCELSTNATLEEVLVHYALDEDFNDEYTAAMTGSKSDGYSVALKNLKENTQYWYRIEAANKYSSKISGTYSFTTPGTKMPSVTIVSVTDITTASATVTAQVSADGGREVVERGICYSTASNPTINSIKIKAGTKGVGNYTLNLSELAENTTYHVRAYAINGKGTAYSLEKTFTTVGINTPTVVIYKIENVTLNSAMVQATVSNDGNADIIERGFCYSTKSGPTISDTKVKGASILAMFTVILSDLEENTTYYVRAYATNSKGTGYSAERTFTTKTITTPTVVINKTQDVTLNSATIQATVSDDGYADVTERGICYSTGTGPTISDTKVKASAAGTGAYTVTLSGLEENTTYYVRAYAINSKGTGYSAEKTFTTKTVTVPSVVIDKIEYSGTGSVSLQATVSDDGYADVTERGVCYSTGSNPTTDDTKVKAGTAGTGAYTVTLPDLEKNTTYYVRAYAINSKGTGYSEVRTVSNNTPVFSQPSVMDITTSTALVQSSLTSDGGNQLTEYGVCYAATKNPTVNNKKITWSPIIVGAVHSETLSGLSANTTYYVRAYAIGSKGTWYSDETSFTTLAGADNTFVFSVSATEKVKFSPGNLQYQASTNTWRFAEHQWNYIGDANTNISSSYSGWIDLFGWGTGDTPTKSSDNEDDYSGFTDWGVNAIGGDALGTWRTLTKEEWLYLFHGRTNAENLFGLGNVYGVNGTIILPDDWVTPSNLEFSPSTTKGLLWQSKGDYYNSSGNNYSHNNYNITQWEKMEASGAVFLPAAGYHNGTKIWDVENFGYYWSSTPYDTNKAYYFGFYRGSLGPQYTYSRSYRCSVRLVR